MSTTTQILFNSPALHSLKREQLVKLCKIHNIKASGKNTELIHKLKQHAQTLPKDSPLSIAARSENTPIEVHQIEGCGDKIGVEIGAIGNDEALDGNAPRYQMPRPSDQWEVVMESIEELEEGSSSQGTLSSLRTLNNPNNGVAGEFGTGGSKSSSMTSSIKALANSLGLKRNASKPTLSSMSSKSRLIPSLPTPSEVTTSDELSRNSVPYAALPASTSLPQTDHFTFTPSQDSMEKIGEKEDPLPGHALRPGVPAPQNARLSLGLGLGAPSTPTRKQPTTTIRLISSNLSSTSLSNIKEPGTPQLKPFETTFDLVLGSPAPSNPTAINFGSLNVWPPPDGSDDHMKIYPTLTVEDLPPALILSPANPPGGSATPSRDKPNLKSPDSPPKSSGQLGPPVEPFVFGSPLPQHRVSNAQFRSAAASVLEEMNKRLQAEGVEGLGTDIIQNLHPGAHSKEELEAPREMKPLPSTRRGEIKEKFEKMHELEFEKMEGIDGLVKRRAVKGDGGANLVIGKKRKSSALGSERDAIRRVPGAVSGRASGTRVISNGRRARALPGAFGEDDGEESGDDNEDEGRRGKRIRVVSQSTDVAEEAQEAVKVKENEEEEEEKRRKEKEREMIRKRLEKNKIKRRSSAAAGGMQGRRSGRISNGGANVKVQKPSRFGFLSSAKSIVQNVWNRGKAATATTNIPKPNVPVPEKKTPFAPPNKAFPAPAHTTAEVANSGHAPSVPANKTTAAAASNTGSSSSRSRLPLPPFAPGRRIMGTDSKSSRNSSLTGYSRNSSMSGPSRNSSVAGTEKSRTSSSGVSSIGTRLSSGKVSTSSGNVSSLGSKKLLSTAGSRTSATGSSSRLSAVPSRLLAPTASSLAKTNRSSTSLAGLRAAHERQGAAVTTNTADTSMKVDILSPLTNTANAKSPGPNPFSPRPMGIFNKPLDMPSGIPTPIKKPATELTRQKSVPGRKPRISRSKVIAKLASQRAAAVTSSQVAGPSSTATPRASHGGRTRSSLGAKAHRSSVGANKRSSGGGDVVMSAKKRARQSEYARRRSRVEAVTLGGGKMEVDSK